MIWKITDKDLGREVFKLGKQIPAGSKDRFKLEHCHYGVIKDYNEDFIFVMMNGEKTVLAQNPHALEYADEFEVNEGYLERKGVSHA